MDEIQKVRDEIAEQIQFLTRFRNDIVMHHRGEGDPELRSRINRGMARARGLVADAGVLKSMTLSPPPAIGGLVVRNADPFNFILESYYGMSTTRTVADMIEEAIGVLERPEYLKRQVSEKGRPAEARASDRHSGKAKKKGEVLALPEKVTITWLAQHVPIRFWFWLIGLLVAAFAAGMRWGPLIPGWQ